MNDNRKNQSSTPVLDSVVEEARRAQKQQQSNNSSAGLVFLIILGVGIYILFKTFSG